MTSIVRSGEPMLDFVSLRLEVATYRDSDMRMTLSLWLVVALLVVELDDDGLNSQTVGLVE